MMQRRFIRPVLLWFACGMAFAAPNITTTSLPNGRVGTAYDQTLNVNGAAGGVVVWSISSGTLPGGLSLNSTNGRITGTPNTAGTSTFAVRVIDRNLQSDTQSLALTVDPAALTVTTSSLPGATFGQSYSQDLSANGGSGTYSWRITAGSLPAGLTLNTSGTIGGTPTGAGNSNFTVTVTDGANRTASKALSIAVTAPALSVTTSSLPNGAVGVGYSQDLAAAGGTGGYTWARSGGALPAGLTLAPSGTIGGTPTAAGASNFAVTVTDNGGRTANKQLTLTVDPNAPAVTTTSLPAGQIGQAYGQTLQASGGSGGYSWTVTGGALPQGLELSAAGAIGGTPTAAGTANFTVTVKDSGGRTASKALSIAVTPGAVTVTTASLPNGQAGAGYSATVEASGGTGGYTWSVTSGALPGGLSMSQGGTITGTPNTPGPSNFTLTVQDNGGRSASKAFTVTILPPGLSITTASLPGGVVGTAYSATVEATGGAGGHRFNVTSGTLPAGLSISVVGAITGTPTSAGTTNVTLTVTDNANATASKAYAITIDPPPPTITTGSLPGGVVGTAYSATVEAKDGSGGNQFSVSGGSLPAGLSMSAGGAITGTPTEAGAPDVTVTVKDSAGRTASKAFKITIEPPPPTITTGSLPGGVVGTAYSATVEAKDGSGGNQFSVTGGSLPAGLAMSGGGAITGTPTAAGTGNFTVTVRDNGGRSTSKALTIAVEPAALTITTASLPGGIVGTAYTSAVEATGGSGGNQFTVTTGALPAGLSINAGSGAITGTPTTAGTANFTVTVRDNGGRSNAKPFTVTIDPPGLSITTASLAKAVVGTAYSATVEAAGGSGGNKFSITTGALPAGLSLSAAGAITGTPTAAGTANFTVTVTDVAGKTAAKPYTLTVDAPALTITTTTLPQGMVGAQYQQALAATGGSGGNAWSISGGNLPAGLNLTAAGTLTGVPTAAGAANFTVQIKDAASVTATKALTLTIVPATLVITTSSLPPAVQGAAYSQTLVATGGTGPYKWSLAAGSLPAGLVLDPAGKISGAVSGGTATFTIGVTDAAGSEATKNLSITVTPPISLPPSTTLPTGVTGTNYSGTIKPSGGQAPFTFALSSGALPPGLALNTATGEIAGRPTQVGSFTFGIQARDAAGGQSQASYTVTIANTLTITNPPVLPGGAVGVPYQVKLIAAGGTAPYSFSATAGSLPAGVSFAADGAIAGTPTTAGTFTVTATVVDAVGGRTSKELTLTVAAALTITTGPQLPQGVPGAPYNAALAATGGTAPYVWSIAAGSLPAGLRLDPSTGAITGFPESPGTANFTVAITDSANVAVQKAFTLTIAPGVTFTSDATLPDAVAGSPYTFTFAATGGRPPYTWRISDGALPGGLALNATSGVISGAPSESGTFNFTVEATDAGGLKGTRVHTLVVNLPSVATFRLSGVPSTLGPLQQPQVDVVISNPYPVPITGRLNLAFAPASGMPDDPSVQFSTGGRSVTFTIAANDTQAVFSVPRLLMQSGSVAGTIQFTVESLRAGSDTLPNPGAPIGSAQVPPAAAMVQTVEVRRTSGGFDLLVSGATTTRELANMTVRFRPPAGTTLQTTEVNIPLSDAAKAWFASNGSSQYGGQFTITVPFTFVGGTSAIESVGVVLSNNIGISQEGSGPY